MLDFYGYDGCGTCRKAKQWLDERGTTYRSIPMVDRPPTQALLKKILAGGDYELKHLFNTSGQMYRQMKIKDKLADMTQAEALQWLSAHGKLCKRPIVTDGKQFTVGFKPDVFENIWG